MPSRNADSPPCFTTISEPKSQVLLGLSPLGWLMAQQGLQIYVLQLVKHGSETSSNLQPSIHANINPVLIHRDQLKKNRAFWNPSDRFNPTFLKSPSMILASSWFPTEIKPAVTLLFLISAASELITDSREERGLENPVNIIIMGGIFNMFSITATNWTIQELLWCYPYGISKDGK